MKRFLTAILIAAFIAVLPLTAKAQNHPADAGRADSFGESVLEAEAGSAAIRPAGAWEKLKMDSLSGGEALSTNEPGAALEFDFTGAAVSADMVAGRGSGRIAVSVDGNPVAVIDLFRTHMTPDVERLILANGLKPGAHTLRIEVLGDRNPGSFDSLVAVDTLRAANAGYGSVSGVLECKYNKGLPVTRGQVTVTGQGGSTDVITDLPGAFSFSALAPGEYTLRIERTGFKTLEQPGLKIVSGQALDLGKVLVEEDAGARPLTFIRYPLGARPAIVRPGDAFSMQVAAPAQASGWRAAIESPWASANLDVSGAVHHPETGRWTVTVKVPSNASPLLYGLKLSFNGGEDFQPRAVMVVPEFKESIRVVHLTDVHVYKSEAHFEMYRRLADEINMINPDVIVVTGDVTDKSGYTEENWPESDQYPAMLDLWNSYNAPTFIIPGNHDLSPHHYEDDYARWNRFFDTTDFSFDCGPYHFTTFDNTYTMTSTGREAPFAEDVFQEQLDWIEKDLAENAGAKMRILAYHVPLHNTESKVRGLAARHDVKLALYGHLHMNAVDKQPPTTYVQTGAAYDGFYRVLNLDNGKIGDINAKKDGVSSFTAGTVESRTKTSEDGRSFTLQVKNSSVMALPGASWRVEMPAANDYSCDGCTIVSRFAGGDKTLVIFTFDIPAKGVATAVVAAR